MLRREARKRGVAVEIVEKDYMLGWILFGIASSSAAGDVAFKGGTALSKVYFPQGWRVSEDLDFTWLQGKGQEKAAVEGFAKAVEMEVPAFLAKRGMTAKHDRTFMNDGNCLQMRMKYAGPINGGTVKIEATKEDFVGNVIKMAIGPHFDCPGFEVMTYEIENILAEKLRALLERKKIRDYYDVWRMLKGAKFDGVKARDLFRKKCQARAIAFSAPAEFFPEGICEQLEPHLKTDLARLTGECLPDINAMLGKLEAPFLGRAQREQGARIPDAVPEA